MSTVPVGSRGRSSRNATRPLRCGPCGNLPGGGLSSGRRKGSSSDGAPPFGQGARADEAHWTASDARCFPASMHGRTRSNWTHGKVPDEHLSSRSSRCKPESGLPKSLFTADRAAGEVFMRIENSEVEEIDDEKRVLCSLAVGQLERRLLEIRASDRNESHVGDPRFVRRQDRA